VVSQLLFYGQKPILQSIVVAIADMTSFVGKIADKIASMESNDDGDEI
jgi:hypothetical protein